ncbi:AAA family ATPase [Kushneria konosiri]|uniref:bifunctional aminoglycoside phosphotransferase/ATP-binding protein n=1 Tax=Kushneria konosiri TaxID=698828 RepID=UPI001D1316F8|nr:bifunctional aminoglycoside phosphotransferase/ATP-binding protein [Kushneria konosiri]
MSPLSQSLISALRSGRFFNHDVSTLQVYETHISWVILTGDYAYKIKKPLDFGFLDFSTLTRRRRFCEDEVRLNRRLAGDLYERVVPISGTPDAPVLDGDGEPFEYAICMRQFDNAGLFSTLQANGELTRTMMDDMVDQLVAFHQSAERVSPDSDFGAPEAVHAPVKQNFDQIRPLLEDQNDLRRLEELAQRAEELYHRFEPLLMKRQREGFVRETHGDVHLANVVQHKGRALIFDCIEFNDDLRYNDVCCELAFLLMDLEARGEHALSSHVLNRYLEGSGDHELVRLLPWYKAYRAMVRAKVALFRLQQPDLHPADRDAALSDYRSYIALAERYSEIDIPWLLISVGVSGSGKSRFTEQVVRSLGAIRLRSDVERKRLCELAPDADSGSSVAGGIYSDDMTRQTYERLASLSGTLMEAGYPVCIDATALKRAQRDRLRHEAEKRGLAALLISFEADDATLRDRLVRRQKRRGEASEAGIEVLDYQLASRDAFGEDELAYLIHLDTTAEDANLTLVSLIRERLRLN